MGETLYRKSWEPLSEADKSDRQLVRHKDSDRMAVYVFDEVTEMWSADNGHYIISGNAGYFEFLCLTPVET